MEIFAILTDISVDITDISIDISEDKMNFPPDLDVVQLSILDWTRGRLRFLLSCYANITR